MKFLFNKIFYLNLGLIWVRIQKYLGLGLRLGPDPRPKPKCLDLVQTLSCNQIGTQANENYCTNYSRNHFECLFNFFNLNKNFVSSPFK